MAKKSGKSQGQKLTPSNKRKGAGASAAGRGGAGPKRTAKAKRTTGRKTAGARTPQGKQARKQGANPPRPGKKKTAAKAKTARASRKTAGAPRAKASTRKSAAGTARKPRRGGTGVERSLDQTPETGRSVKGPTNPMPTRRSTGTAAGAGSTRRAPGLERQRRQLRELEESLPSPPSSLNLDRSPSAARSGRRELRDSQREHNEVSPEITAGDVDADWADAYSVGDEAPGGDNPTPDQDRVDDIGKALGVQYEDNEELKAVDKIAERDRHRWELDPASAEDYTEHLKADEDEE